jgi:hypothetical protein
LEQKTGLRNNNIRLNRLLSCLCKSCRTSFGFCRGLLRTHLWSFRHRRPYFAESRSSATVIAGLHRFLVPSLPKTQNTRGFRPRYARVKTFVFFHTIDHESTDRCFLRACYGNPLILDRESTDRCFLYACYGNPNACLFVSARKGV